VSARLFAVGGVGAGIAILLARIVPDVHGKPLFEDEAVSGLIAARPLPEIVLTVLWDRGGAPLHFLVAHAAFAVDGDSATLRWLSVAFAAATVPVAYDLGRRLSGPVAGATAAVLTGCSGILAVYGSFGRMYALMAFAGALAADLFARALERRTARASAWAAAGAWLLVAVHPYGGLVAAVEAGVGLWLWRGRPLRAALPVALISLAALPFIVGDLRLASRFEVSGDQDERLATRGEAWDLLVSALRGFTGGGGLLFAVFVALALVGAALLVRRNGAFVVFALVSLALPVVLIALVPTGRAPDLSPRHLIYALAVWAALAGVALERGSRALGPPGQALAVGGIAVLAAFSTGGVVDPREVTYTAALGGEDAVAEPAAWLEKTISGGDALYPYSSVFLAALPEVGKATALPRAQSQSLLAAVDRLDYPVGSVVVAVPTGTAQVAPVGGGRRFDRWLLIRRQGPFDRPVEVLGAVSEALGLAEAAVSDPPPALAGWFALNEQVLCESLAARGAACPAGG
jgi:hypothetical protein